MNKSKHLNDLMSQNSLVIFSLFAILLSSHIPARANEPNLDVVALHLTDISGQAVNIPSPDRVTMLVFVMANQARSREIQKQITKIVGTKKEMQVLAVISGSDAFKHAKQLSQTKNWHWPVLADPAYKLSGKMIIRAWPTTVLINKQGKRVAHIAGLPASFNKDLIAHIAFAEGEIDRQTLNKRLGSYQIITSSPHQIASRHLQLALRMISRDQLQVAKKELTIGLKIAPKHPQLNLTMARVYLLLQKPKKAMAILDTIDKKSIASWARKTLTGRAYVQLKQWEAARTDLTKALKLNPNPCEAHYFLALVYEHEKDWQQAAQHFKQAFIHTPTARVLKVKSLMTSP